MFKTLFCVAVACALAPAEAAAQQPPVTVSLPPVTVTAQKDPEDPQTLPLSVTAVPGGTLMSAGLSSVSQAGWFAPNTYFNEFTARKLSNARFRGIGASPSNPAVTSYIDGVPQLNANSSSIELVDVEQIEFVRGPQSALFGRNALGGVINIVSGRPSLKRWTGSVVGPYGNFNAGDVRGSVSGPIVADKLGVGFAIGYSQREGFTTNDVTGHDLDSRSAFFAKGQMLFKPTARFETRVMFTGERARDGDYALNDLDAVRARPFHASSNVDGYTHRDILAPTIQTTYTGSTIDFATTTGFLKWKTSDFTDLDYTALPLATRTNAEDFQFTIERVSSAKPRLILGSRHDAGGRRACCIHAELHTGCSQQLLAFVLSPFINFPVTQHSLRSSLTMSDRLRAGHGRLRNVRRRVRAAGDVENKSADLNTFISGDRPGDRQSERTFSDGRRSSRSRSVRAPRASTARRG
jgi:iron complex outermembrane receptor protein